MTVQSASVSESWAIDHKAPEILTQLSPQTLTADDAYTQASRIRRWAKSQVALITPALDGQRDVMPRLIIDLSTNRNNAGT